MSIHERLKEERERLRIPQDRFAAVGGVGKRSQINYEAGERLPDASYLANIAVLGADIAYVVTGTRAGGTLPGPALTAEEETLLAYYRDATKSVRRAALGALIGASPVPGSGVRDVTMTSHAQGGVQIGVAMGGVNASGKRQPKT